MRVVGGVVGGSSLSGHSIAINMKLTAKLRLHIFTLGWDPTSIHEWATFLPLLNEFTLEWDPD